MLMYSPLCKLVTWYDHTTGQKIYNMQQCEKNIIFKEYNFIQFMRFWYSTFTVSTSWIMTHKGW